MAVEYEISSDVATITGVASNTQVASIVKFYTGSITYDDEPTSKYASVTINGKTQRVMLCVAVSGTATYDDVPCLYSTVSGHRTLNVVEPTESGTPDDVPSLYETVVVDGKTVRALRCVLINTTPNYDGVSSTCTFTDNGKTHTAQLINQVSSGSIETIVKGVSPLSLPDAVANSLSYVKAFGGTEQRNLPDGYTHLEYIEGTGTQYIDTGILINKTLAKKLTLESEMLVTSTGGYRLCGIGGVASQFYFGLNPYTHFAYGSGITDADTNKIASLDTWYKYSYSPKNGKYTVRDSNDEVVTSTSFNFSENFSVKNYPILLFAYASGSSGGATGVWSGKISSFKVYEENVLIQDMVPARSASGVVGMYDLVSGQFFTNAGTGDFAAGPVAVPTPDTPMDIISNNGVLKARHQSGLPLGYTLLEYIESTRTQYIDTGVGLNAANKITGKISFVTLNNLAYIAGGRLSGGVAIGYALYAASHSGFTIYNTSWSEQGIDVSANQILEFETVMKSGQQSFIVNGNTIVTGDRTISLDSRNIYLFGLKTEYMAAAKVYSLKIYDNNTLVRDFVPAKNSSGVVGMYDTVNNRFYTNAGTGEFIAGDPVSDPVEIYADGTVETIKDSLNNTATAEMLLKFGDYQDVQSIIDGVVTRNVGVKVLDGTEAWAPNLYPQPNAYRISWIGATATLGTIRYSGLFCTHFEDGGLVATTAPNKMFFANDLNINFPMTSDFDTRDKCVQYLADQYAAGTPVTIVYPLAQAVTEQVAPQVLNVQTGDNILEITQASLSNLELEAKYSKSA